MNHKKLTYKQVMSKYKQGDTFTAWVDCNPKGAGTRTKLNFTRGGTYISSFSLGKDIFDGVDYGWTESWETSYKGLFEIVTEEPVKEVTIQEEDNIMETITINGKKYKLTLIN